MASRLTITETELLEAIAQAAPLGRRGPDDARTVNEIAEASNMSVWAVRKALAVLKKQGRLNVHNVVRPSIGGVMRAAPGYTIAPATSKKRRAV